MEVSRNLVEQDQVLSRMRGKAFEGIEGWKRQPSEGSECTQLLRSSSSSWLRMWAPEMVCYFKTKKLLACFSANGNDLVRRENDEAEEKETCWGQYPQIGKGGWDQVKKTWPFPGLECVQVSGLFGLFIFF